MLNEDRYKRRKVVRDPSGIEVDASTGEVLEDRPIDFEHPEYRIFDYQDYLERSHHHPMKEKKAEKRALSTSLACGDEESINEILDRLLPGLVAVLRNLLLTSLCSTTQSSPAPGVDTLRRIIESRISMSAREAEAYDEGGFVGLLVYRCLRNAGANEEEVLNALRRHAENAQVPNNLRVVVEGLKNSITRAFDGVLIRWISKPAGDIDLEHASRVLGAPIKRARRALQIVTKVDGLGVQITSKKIDISSTIRDEKKVVEVLSKLSKRLGVELSSPIPMVATVVIKMPCEIDFDILKRFEPRAVFQGSRVKIEGDYWTALIFRKTINIYVDLRGNIGRFRSAVAEILPDVCRYIRL